MQIRILKLNYSKTTNIYTMGLCVLYYVEYSLYDVKKVGFFYLGWNYTLKYLVEFNLFFMLRRLTPEDNVFSLTLPRSAESEPL